MHGPVWVLGLLLNAQKIILKFSSFLRKPRTGPQTSSVFGLWCSAAVSSRALVAPMFTTPQLEIAMVMCGSSTVFAGTLRAIQQPILI